MSGKIAESKLPVHSSARASSAVETQPAARRASPTMQSANAATGREFVAL